MVNKIWFILVLGCAGRKAGAQPFAQIALDRNTVYVQQPFRVTITVLTPTWYTAPLDFDNFRIPGAFILPFDQTTPGMFTVGGKTYAGLQFYFIVFPYQPGRFVIPPIRIVAHTPPAAGGTSVEVTVQTSEQPFTVKEVPASRKEGGWFVARNVTVSQRWGQSLKQLKVGDILARTVVIDAGGTLPQFIPVLRKEPLLFADSYLKPAHLRDERNDHDAAGRLTQTVVYLLEKEGDFELPAIVVSWWDPLTGKVYSREAAAVRIHVGSNPDLGILRTLKDSLNASLPAVVNAPAPKGPARILWIAVGVWLLSYLVRWSIAGLQRYRRRHALYLAGERYAFRQLMRTSPKGKPFLRALYGWWDRVTLPGKSSSLTGQMRQQGFGKIERSLNCFFGELYGKGNEDARANKELRKDIRIYRKTARLNC